MRRTLVTLSAAALLGAVLPVAGASGAPPTDARPGGACAGADRIAVPGAEHERVSPCLPDLTTGALKGLLDAAGKPLYTDPADYAGLTAAGTVSPTGVRGVQVDGYFPDTSRTNTLHGWNHDAQFVIRLPEDWNGGLVVAGAPGVRRQYSSDVLVSDRVLGRGFAYASIDKGNTGALFFQDGEQPGDAIREWHARVTQVAQAAQAVVRQAYGRPAARTYMTGVSNGGYLTRWQLENRPGVFDGGVDSEGTLFERDANLLTYLPPALRSYPAYAAAAEGSPEREAARRQMHAAGFAPGSEALWPLHHAVYWDLTQRIYREELDPAFDGDLLAGGTATCPLGRTGCASDIGYRLEEQDQEALDAAFRGITLTGALKRPMLSVHGTLDALLPISLHAERYADLVAEQDRGRLHRLYVVDRAQHVDGFLDRPDLAGADLRALLPCYTEAFDALVAWVEQGVEPPASGHVVPVAGRAVDDCTL